MMYSEWIDTIVKQLNEYKRAEETDLVLLRNHLNMVVDDIERSPEFKIQLSKCID